MLPGAMIPTQASVDKVLPGYYEKYQPQSRGNMDKYLSTLKDRFQQRRDFLSGSDLTERPLLLEEIVKTLQVNI